MKKTSTTALLVLASCSTKASHKNADVAPAPKASVCQFVALEQIDSESGPFPHSLQCMEGFIERKTASGFTEKDRIDCANGGGRQFDKDGRLFKQFEGATCPGQDVIAVCVGCTFKFFLYSSELSTDKEHFAKYCRDLKGLVATTE